MSKWLAGDGGLPAETRTYVAAITGLPAEDWRTGPAKAIEYPEGGPPAKPESKDATDAKPAAPQTCLQVTAALRIPSRGDRFALGLNEGPAAPWASSLPAIFPRPWRSRASIARGAPMRA